MPPSRLPSSSFRWLPNCFCHKLTLYSGTINPYWLDPEVVSRFSMFNWKSRRVLYVFGAIMWSNIRLGLKWNILPLDRGQKLQLNLKRNLVVCWKCVLQLAVTHRKQNTWKYPLIRFFSLLCTHVWYCDYFLRKIYITLHFT